MAARRKVIVGAIGPSLTSLGVSGALPDPSLKLHNTKGDLLDSNDNWQSDHEAGPENYTAIVAGVNGTTEVGLAEVNGL